MTMSGTRKTWAAVLGVVLLGALWFVLPQLGVVVLSALLAYIFRPFFLRLRRIGRGPAVALTLVSTFLVVLVPLGFVVISAVGQLGRIASVAGRMQYWETMPEVVRKAIDIADDVLSSVTGVRPSITDQSVSEFLRTAVPAVARTGTQLLVSVAGNLPGLFVAVIVYIFLFIEFTLRGPELVRAVERISPFDQIVTDTYVRRIGLMSKAMVTGQLIISLVLSIFSSLLLIPLGYGHSFFIFLILFTVLNFIPLGCGVVFIPLTVYSMVTGHFWLGLVLLVLFYAFGNVDPIMRSRLIPDEIHLSVGMTMLATFCGVAHFGILGVVYGPIIMILVITTVDFANQFREGRPHDPEAVTSATTGAGTTTGAVD